MPPLAATVELNLSLARPAIAMCRVAALVIGQARAIRIAEWATLRLTRWRVAGQRRWQWLGVDPGAPSLWLRTWTMVVFVVIPAAVATAAVIGALWLLWEVCCG